MSQLSSVIETQISETKLAVSFQVLLGLYSIIPLCLALQFIDSLFLNHQLLKNLPTSPTHFLLFQLLFGTPHILASSLLISSNSEYLQFYKYKLLIMSALIISLFGIGSLFIPYKMLYVISVCWTVYHVLKQQIGVGRGVYRLPNWGFYTVLWLSVLAGIFIYLGIFLNLSLSTEELEWINYIAEILTAGLVLITVICQRFVDNSFGKLFLWANTLLVVASFYLYLQEYYFFAILMPRLVHDATAYIFYVTHDYNKHTPQPKNWLYRSANRCNIHIFLVLPLISVLLTLLLQMYGDDIVNFFTRAVFGVEVYKAITLGLIGYLSLMHYYTEAFTWKQGSPLRAFITFKK